MMYTCVRILKSNADFSECICFRDLLHELEKCNADPVAIAECFVSKVKMFVPTFFPRPSSSPFICLLCLHTHSYPAC